MNDLQDTMMEVSRLTRAGRLTEATALIQRTLSNKKANEASPRSTSSTEAPIDAEFTILDDTASPERTSPQETPMISMRRLTSEQRGGTPGMWPHHVQQPFTRRSPFFPGKARTWTTGGGQWVEQIYSNSYGSRPYRLYLPRGYTGEKAPLLVMLHGCSQSSLDFASGTRMNELADRHMFLVAYPEQVVSANSSKCWRWFQVSDQQREKGEPSLIAEMTWEIMSQYNINDRHVCIAGLSSGGAMAAIMAATYPDLYAAVGVHSGLPYGAARDLSSAFTVMRQGASQWNRSIAETIPLIIFHGDADTTVAPINADQLAEQWLKGSERRPATKQRRDSHSIEGQISGGHSYTRTIYHDLHGQAIVEKWMVHQAGHAWAGGSSNGSYTDARGPDASREMVRFFAEHSKKR
ncbi:MAG: PHB depolymerase family esterase [Chloroflexi bacterium]|nr:PHB depolymerase family esterase [Chloroflexota bacterium]